MESRDWAIRQVSLKELSARRVDAAHSLYAVGRIQNRKQDASRDSSRKKPALDFKKIYACKINKNGVDCRI
ncbi:hypothetical protein [Acetonema longum]|uniref:Uncharacterized protein n=1 Tax=Acetonema longum DSM 6540 TaxID=1009370 RepID=F7NEL2_9FIRM|nr:hypothetical protein [Acetonema longum]EGO65423.1 hypothetical protein ALO_02376 [Acetonema longum DSM 6540]